MRKANLGKHASGCEPIQAIAPSFAASTHHLTGAPFPMTASRHTSVATTKCLPDATPPAAIHRMKRFVASGAAILLLTFTLPIAQSARGPGTLEDLKKIEIICYLPTWLPKGLKV